MAISKWLTPGYWLTKKAVLPGQPDPIANGIFIPLAGGCPGTARHAHSHGHEDQDGGECLAGHFRSLSFKMG